MPKGNIRKTKKDLDKVAGGYIRAPGPTTPTGGLIEPSHEQDVNAQLPNEGAGSVIAGGDAGYSQIGGVVGGRSRQTGTTGTGGATPPGGGPDVEVPHQGIASTPGAEIDYSQAGGVAAGTRRDTGQGNAGQPNTQAAVDGTIHIVVQDADLAGPGSSTPS